MEPNQENEGEILVYPLMGIIANIPRWKKKGTGKFVGWSGLDLQGALTHQLLDPVQVNPQENNEGFLGFAVVEFKNDLSRIQNAMVFERMFKGDQHGKEHFNVSRNVGDGLFGWIARADDYNYRSSEENSKTIHDLLIEEKNKLASPVLTLTRESDESIKKFGSKEN